MLSLVSTCNVAPAAANRSRTDCGSSTKTRLASTGQTGWKARAASRAPQRPPERVRARARAPAPHPPRPGFGGPRQGEPQIVGQERRELGGDEPVLGDEVSAALAPLRHGDRPGRIEEHDRLGGERTALGG